jgi:folylpolyglutamate synthase/dihydropteroate synthase
MEITTFHKWIYEKSNPPSGNRKHTIGRKTNRKRSRPKAVLSVTLFLVAMADITHGIEELIKIIGYADDWIIHTTHKHEQLSVVKLQKAKGNFHKSSEQSAKINTFYSTANYNQNRVIITDSLSTIMAVSDIKRSKNPKTQLIRKLIHK